MAARLAAWQLQCDKRYAQALPFWSGRADGEYMVLHMVKDYHGMHAKFANIRTEMSPGIFFTRADATAGDDTMCSREGLSIVLNLEVSGSQVTLETPRAGRWNAHFKRVPTAHAIGALVMLTGLSADDTDAFMFLGRVGRVVERLADNQHRVQLAKVSWEPQTGEPLTVLVAHHHIKPFTPMPDDFMRAGAGGGAAAAAAPVAGVKREREAGK